MKVDEKAFRFHKMAQSYFSAAIRLLEIEKPYEENEHSMAISPFEISFLPGRSMNDFYNAPVLYMIRQGLELMLKSIHLNLSLCGFETNVVARIEKTHNLKILYEQFLDIAPKVQGFESVCARHTSSSYRAFVQLLADFHTYDPKGEIFRFSVTKGGDSLRVFGDFSSKEVANSYILIVHKANEYMCRVNNFLEIKLIDTENL